MTETHQIQITGCGGPVVNDGLIFKYEVEKDGVTYHVTIDDERTIIRYENSDGTTEEIQDDNHYAVQCKKGRQCIETMYRIRSPEYDEYTKNIDKLNEKLSTRHIKPKSYKQFKSEREKRINNSDDDNPLLYQYWE